VVDLSETVATQNLAMEAAPLDVTYNPIFGATADSGSFFICQSGFYQYLSSSMTYASGSIAAELDLTQGTGAYLSTPGQVVTSPSAFMNNVVNLLQSKDEGFASFQTAYPAKGDTPPEVLAALESWAESSGGNYAYEEYWNVNTPPIVDSFSSALQLSATPAAATVPEPPTWAMILVSFASLGLAGYRLRPRVGQVAAAF
jgi:hypothetical protein